MEPNAAVTLLRGDAADKLGTLAPGSVHAVVTDPPYGLNRRIDAAALVTAWLTDDRDAAAAAVGTTGLLGKDWDATVASPATWGQVLRVLRPGGHLVVFAGTRTADLVGLSLRLAGAEVVGQVAWLHGGGAPKGVDLGRATNDRWAGWRSGLKPSHEPIIVARRPLRSTVVDCLATNGTGALHVDACRVGDLRRYPADVVLSHAEGCEAERCVESCAVVGLDDSSGWLKPRGNVNPTRSGGGGSDDVVGTRTTRIADFGPGDGGGASRFMYCAKASRTERNAGLEGATNTHATVKPVELMRWLVRLTTPPGGVVLDPFVGSGTTLVAAIAEGFDSIGIDRDDLAIAAARCVHAGAHLVHDEVAKAR